MLGVLTLTFIIEPYFIMLVWLFMLKRSLPWSKKENEHFLILRKKMFVFLFMPRGNCFIGTIFRKMYWNHA